MPGMIISYHSMFECKQLTLQMKCIRSSFQTHSERQLLFKQLDQRTCSGGEKIRNEKVSRMMEMIWRWKIASYRDQNNQKSRCYRNENARLATQRHRMNIVIIYQNHSNCFNSINCICFVSVFCECMTSYIYLLKNGMFKPAPLHTTHCHR